MTTARRIAGYEVEHRLGDGATSTVWRARQVSALDRPVALKRVAAGDRVAAERIRAEAAALACLDHPHIVRIIEVIDEGGDDDVTIAMQFAAGGSLADRMARRDAVPAGEAMHIALDVAAALASAHRRGFLHLDVKPANVLFTADGEVLLADFGAVGGAAGTPGFAAPEVIAGGTADARSDVYGLGALLGAMVGPAPPMSLAEVIGRATASDPAARFASMDELAAALRTIGRPDAGTSDVATMQVTARESPGCTIAGERGLSVAGGPSTGPEPRKTRSRAGCEDSVSREVPAPDLRRARRDRGRRQASEDSVSREVRVPDLRRARRDGGRRTSTLASEPATTPASTHDGQTREFGPRSPRTDGGSRVKPQRARNRFVLSGVAIVVLVGVAGVAFLRPAPTARHHHRAVSTVAAHPRSCPDAAPLVVPSGADVLYADVDGDGCDEPIARDGNTLVRGGIRFELGRPGDIALLGDWDCDGVATAAVWRASVREAYVFDAWAPPGQPLPAARTIVATAAPTARC